MVALNQVEFPILSFHEANICHHLFSTLFDFFMKIGRQFGRGRSGGQRRLDYTNGNLNNSYRGRALPFNRGGAHTNRVRNNRQDRAAQSLDSSIGGNYYGRDRKSVLIEQDKRPDEGDHRRLEEVDSLKLASIPLLPLAPKLPETPILADASKDAEHKTDIVESS